MSTLAKSSLVYPMASVCIAFCFNGPMASADDGAVGTWLLSTVVGSETSESTVKITASDGELQGTIVSSRGDRKLKNISFVNGVLRFDTYIRHGGQEVPLSFKGKIEEDSVRGTWSSGDGRASAAGKRRGVTANAAIVGMWKLTTKSAIGENTRELIVNPDLTGTYGGGDFDAFAISNLQVDGDRASMDVTLRHAGVKLPSTIQLTVDGDTLKGSLDYGDGEATIVGERAMISIAGTWMLLAESELGKNTRKFVINPNMTGTYGGGIFDDYPISNLVINGNRATMDVTLEFQEVKLPSTIDLTFEGDDLSGTLDYGQGKATISGYRE